MSAERLEFLVDFANDGFRSDVSFTNEQAAVAGQFAEFTSRPLNSAAATRALLTVPNLSETEGSVLAWFDPDADYVLAAGGSHRVFCWGDSATKYIEGGWHPSLGFFTGSYDGTGDDATTSVAAAAGVGVCAYFGWDASTLAVATDANAEATTSRSKTPALTATAVEIGRLASSAASYLDGGLAGIAFFSRRLTLAEREEFTALARPPLFGEVVGRDMIDLWYGEDTDHYDDPLDIVTPELVEFSTSYGRNAQSQLTSRAVAGKLTAVLNNGDGRYSPSYSSSPLAGLLAADLPMQTRIATETAHHPLWGGFTDGAPSPGFTAGRYQRVVLSGTGPIRILGDAEADIIAQVNQDTGTLVGAVLDAAGWPTADRTIDTGISVPELYFTSRSTKALNALRDLEDTEFGFVRETKDRKVAFENRHHRYKSPHITSQATISDAPAAALSMFSASEANPLRELYNAAAVTVRQYGAAAAVATLWEWTGSTDIAPGETRSFSAWWPNIDQPEGAYVSSWTTTDATDITVTGAAFSDLAIALTKRAQSMRIAITNNHASATASVTYLRARGAAVSEVDPVTVNVDNSGSAKVREYPFAGKWLSDLSQATDLANAIARRQNPPPSLLDISIKPRRGGMATLLDLDVSDRITVVAENTVKLGVNADFYVEAIHHRYTRTEWSMSMLLSEADAASYWAAGIAGLSEAGITTRAAF